MEIRRLRLLNFRQHAETVVEFDRGLTGIIGPNGAGKTTLLEAIAWAIYGTDAARGTKETIKRRGAPPRSRVEVELEFDLGPHRYRVVRTLAQAQLYLDKEPAPIANSVNAGASVRSTVNPIGCGVSTATAPPPHATNSAAADPMRGASANEEIASLAAGPAVNGNVIHAARNNHTLTDMAVVWPAYTAPRWVTTPRIRRSVTAATEPASTPGSRLLIPRGARGRVRTGGSSAVSLRPSLCWSPYW